MECYEKLKRFFDFEVAIGSCTIKYLQGSFYHPLANWSAVAIGTRWCDWVREGKVDWSSDHTGSHQIGQRFSSFAGSRQIVLHGKREAFKVLSSLLEAKLRHRMFLEYFSGSLWLRSVRRYSRRGNQNLWIGKNELHRSVETLRWKRKIQIMRMFLALQLGYLQLWNGSNQTRRQQRDDCRLQIQRFWLHHASTPSPVHNHRQSKLHWRPPWTVCRHFSSFILRTFLLFHPQNSHRFDCVLLQITKANHSSSTLDVDKRCRLFRSWTSPHLWRRSPGGSHSNFKYFFREPRTRTRAREDVKVGPDWTPSVNNQPSPFPRLLDAINFFLPIRVV